MRVFATVLDIMKRYIDKFKPEKIYFSADKDEVSRVSLYKRMVKRFTPKSWKVELKDSTSYALGFVIHPSYD